MSSPRIRGAATPVAAPPPNTSFVQRRHARAALIFIGPFLALFAFVYAAPVIYSIGQSLFTERTSGLGYGGSESVFVGLGNYLTVLTDSGFWAGLWHVLLFGIVQVPIMLLSALGIALLLDSVAARGVKTFRILTFLPYAVPGVVAAVMWSYLYSPQLSPISQLLETLGIPLNFLAPGTVLWSIANITTWGYTGYNSLIIFAALKAIPSELFEAARIDGAGEWTIARRIKVPAVRNAIVLAGVMSVIGTMQLFTEPTILKTISTAVDAEYTPTMYAFNAAFNMGDYGTASAASIVIAFIAGALSIVFFRIVSRGGSQ